jgi:uncharacterized SAM-binding protein YcdF (DUF218 family)
MFFIISKILNFLNYPLTWVVIILLSGIIFRKRFQRKALIAAFAILLVFSNQFIFAIAMRLWEKPARHTNEMPTYDVGIVLGGMSSYDPNYDRIQAYRGIDRLLQALELYHKGIIKKIFISGGSGSLIFPDMLEGVYLKNYLITIGVPEEDVLSENQSKNTRENAIYTKKALTEANLEDKKLLLITSGYHVKRAQACFSKEGLITDYYSVDRITGDGPIRKDLDFLLIPSSETLFLWSALLHEWIGVVAYKIMGYI